TRVAMVFQRTKQASTQRFGQDFSKARITNVAGKLHAGGLVTSLGHPEAKIRQTGGDRFHFDLSVPVPTVPALETMRWTLLVAEYPHTFITCDNPVQTTTDLAGVLTGVQW